MPNAERLSTYLPLVNAGAVRVQPVDYTDWLPQQTVEIPGDPTIPAAPTISAAPANQAIDLALVKPEENTDGSPFVDFDRFEVFYSNTSGINIDNPETYIGKFETRSTQHTFPTEATCYFRAVVWDRYGNRSAASNEASATPTSAETTPEVDDYSQNIAGVYVGKGMIGIEFQPPKSTWVRWTGWKLYYDVDQGSGWSGTWTLIYSGQEPGFLHKNLNENYRYKYKLAVTAEGGVETNGTVADNGGTGYQANASDQSAILGRTIFAERIIATTEIVSRTLKGGTLQSLNWGTSSGTELNLDAGTFKLGGSTSPKLSWDGSTLSIVGNVTITGGSGISNLSDAGALATLDQVQSVHIADGAITAAKIAAGAVTADKIAAGAVTASKISVTALSDISSSLGTVTGGNLGGSNVVTIDSSGLNVGAYGSIRGGKSAYGSGTGFFLGYSGGTYKLDIGSSSQYLRWDGSTLYVKGSIVADSGSSIHGSYLADGSVTDAKIQYISASKVTAGTFIGSSFQTASSGKRVEMWASGSYAHTIRGIDYYGYLAFNLYPGTVGGHLELWYSGSNVATLSWNSNGASLTGMWLNRATFLSSTVFSGTAPTSWSSLNLSSYVGSNPALVFLRIRNNSSLTTLNVRFRPSGSNWQPGMYADTHPSTCNTRIYPAEDGFVWVKTNSSGSLEWAADTSASVTVYLEAYIS